MSDEHGTAKQLEELRQMIRDGSVDTVIVALTDMQGRLMGKRLRVHGHVVSGTLVHQAGTLEYHFMLESKAPREHATMNVDFHGIPPDLFKPGAEVIAAGVLGTDGMLRSDRIETKCPSKYETQAKQ